MEAFGILSFRCNICGNRCSHPAAALTRESTSCRSCGSSVRMRSMIHALSCALFGRSLALPDFPDDPSLRGVGMSDWLGYADPLEKKLGYVNTYYHKEPRLDITAIAEKDVDSVDFIISTDVFEHVCPPVQVAFENTLKMLRPHGAFVFSVPFKTDGHTVEHFPDLHDFRIEEREGQRVLVNTTKSGEQQEFGNLIFHGGEGDTLEMRLFSLGDLMRDLAKAGFQDVQVMSQPCFEFGIYHDIALSLPIVARREPALVQVTAFGPRLAPRRNVAPGEPAQWLWITLKKNELQGPVEVWFGNYPCAEVNSGPELITARIPDEVLARSGIHQITLKAPNAAYPIRAGAVCVYG